MSYDDFVEHLEGVRMSGAGHVAQCPSHEDSHASLSISEGEDGTILLFCHAGCQPKDIVDAMGLRMSDLFPEEDEVVYTYRDAQSQPVYEVVRMPNKDFRQRHYENGELVWGMNGVTRVLYNLPEVLRADLAQTIYVVEGEKDADAIARSGGIATCNVGGAGKWDESYSLPLIGRNIVIVQDKDDAGRKHASQVRLALKGKAKRVRVVEARHGKDAADHLAAGYGLEQFIEYSRFKAFDFLNPPPEPEWLLPGLIAQTDRVLLAGMGKLGKSWLYQALAVTIAMGGGIFLDEKVPAGRVLIFDEENPGDVIHKRLVTKLGLTNFDDFRMIWNAGLRLDRHPELLLEEAIDYEPGLIVIDSLSRVHGRDENSFAEMSEILNGVLKELARETGAAVLLIHHHSRHGHAPRGSSDIENAVDAIINVNGIPGQGQFNLSAAGRRQKSGFGMSVAIVDDPLTGRVRLERQVPQVS